MATVHQSDLVEIGIGRRLGVIRVFAAGGLTASAVFVLCWLGTFIPFSSPTHAYISLFTTADVGSGLALVEGSCWSFLFGALVGGVFAVLYKLLAGLDRR